MITMKNVLHISSRKQFRDWLEKYSTIEDEVWVNSVRKKPDDITFTYLDAVEEALCFGWIDSVWKKVGGIFMQRFSPRRKNSPWTELNKERARRLMKLGLMTPQGEKTLPKMRYIEDKEVIKELKKARVYTKFKSFPPLYQRIRIYNVSFYRKISKKKYEASLKHLIEMTKAGKMYGEWNDYGRLLNY